MKTVSLFGIPVVTGGREELAALAASLLQTGGKIATLNPVMLTYALTNRRFRKTLAGFTVIPDGIGIAVAVRLSGGKTDVFPGVELAWEMAKNARRVGIYGGAPGVAERAFFALSGAAPALAPAFLFDGYGSTDDDVRVALGTAPDLVLIGLGTPRQEKTVAALAGASPGALFIGVGGALDVYAGDKKRAPSAVRRRHLEWAYRIIMEPGRLRHLPRLLLFCAALPILPFSRIFHKKRMKNC